MNTQNFNTLINAEDSEAFAKAFKENGNNIYETLIDNPTEPLNKEKLEKEKQPMPAEKILQIRNDVEQLHSANKSKRFIRRYIKRKYNITEY